MDRRHFLATAFGMSAGVLLAGCGGGGGGDRTARGTVALPDGFSTGGAALTVETMQGGEVVGTGGAFSIPIGASENPTLAWARAGDTLALLGFLGVRSGAETIDPRSTAVALLYFGLGGFTLPATNTRTLLGLLEAHTAVGPLTETLARRLAVRPSALVEGDSEVGAALKTALDTILAERPTPSRSTAKVTRSRQETGSALLLVEPATRQSNLEALQGDAAQTFSVTNHSRRYCQVRLYEIATEDASGVKTEHPQARLVSDPLRLDSTRALGFVSTLFGYSSGTTAFVPVSTRPIRAEMAAGVTKTLFEAVVLGSTTLQFEPAFFSEARYAGDVDAWRSSIKNLNLISWFMDIILGILLEIWGLRDLAVQTEQIEGILATLRQLEIASWLEVFTAAENGDISGATRAFLRLFTTNSEFVKSLQAVLASLSPQIQALIGKEASGASLKLVTTAVSAAFSVVGVALGAGDLGAVLWDLAHAERGERWSLTLYQPTLKLSPATASIRKGGRVSFQASVPGVSGKLIYVWSLSGGIASILSSSDGKVGSSIETTSGAVELATTPSDQGTITVTVKAYREENGVRTFIEQRTATVTLGDTVDVPSTLIFVDDPGANRVLGQGEPVMVWGFTFPKEPDAQSYRIELVAAPGLEPRSVARVQSADLGSSGSLADIWKASQALAPIPYTIVAGTDNFGFRGGFFHIGQSVFVPMGVTGYGPDEFTGFKNRAEAEESIRNNWLAASQRRLLVQASV